MTLESAKDEYGKPLVLTLAELRQQGPYGQYLKDKLDNPDLEAIISGGAICESKRLDGNLNKHGAWKEVLQGIHSRTAGSCLDKTTAI